ncbi:MAG: HK97 gp10 family phage protein [Clostridiales bacterium]|jgi:HK97 gp10 family phage protein|nr:HK97 gp10 family phage protein [Eubacteriales bacterium]MDH7567398.1 HK97 gp10 family phage protein [Clostridiales bacterium]
MARAYTARIKKLKAEVEGAEEVIKLLEEMGQKAEEVLAKAAEAGGMVALSEARRRCPVKTGRLRASLTLTQGKKTPARANVRIEHGKKEYYGTFVELGTRKQPARPFMRPAVDENKKQISDAVTEEIGRAVGRAR